MSTAILVYSQYFASVCRMSFCDTKKRILYCSNFKYFLFLSFPLNPLTFQILRYIGHFHVFVSQKFIYNKIGIRRNRLKHRPNKMIRQSVRTLFRPSGGPSHCSSVNSFIHPSIQTSQQLIKNLGQNPKSIALIL